MSNNYNNGNGLGHSGRVTRIESAKAGRTGQVVKGLGITAATGLVLVGGNMLADAVGVDVSDPGANKVPPTKIGQVAEFVNHDSGVYDEQGNPQPQIVIERSPTEPPAQAGK